LKTCRAFLICHKGVRHTPERKWHECRIGCPRQRGQPDSIQRVETVWEELAELCLYVRCAVREAVNLHATSRFEPVPEGNREIRLAPDGLICINKWKWRQIRRHIAHRREREAKAID